MYCDGSIPNEVFVIIGNGFDIECKLPTRYTDFLKFLLCIQNILDDPDIQKDEQAIISIATDSLIDLKTEIVDKLIKNSEKLELWQPVIDNYWYKHFIPLLYQTEDKWVDFENEISKVVRKIEESMTLPNGKTAEKDEEINLILNADLKAVVNLVLTPEELAHSFYGSNQYSKLPTYQELSKRLLDDLNAFVNGFETYLRDYVACISPTRTASIDRLIDKLRYCGQVHVLTFNYTDTFEKMLNEEHISAKFCYVHGKVGDGSKNTMVLGINEHLNEYEMKKYIVFAPFRKYNQRIFKGTDSCYFDWLPEKEAAILSMRRLYIFGHSLGISDKDILKRFIEYDNMFTTIYYHSEKMFSDQLGNLTAIIEMNEVIRRTGGQFRTLEFEKQ